MLPPNKGLYGFLFVCLFVCFVGFMCAWVVVGVFSPTMNCLGGIQHNLLHYKYRVISSYSHMYISHMYIHMCVSAYAHARL